MNNLVLVIKNPARSSGEDFRLQLSSQCTIQELKQKLQAEYEGNPSPECQTLIYCGKVLRDASETIANIIKSHIQAQGDSPVHTVHLVVKQPTAAAASSPGPSTSAASVQPRAPASREEPPPPQAQQQTPAAAAAAAAPQPHQPPAAQTAPGMQQQQRQPEEPMAPPRRQPRAPPSTPPSSAASTAGSAIGSRSTAEPSQAELQEDPQYQDPFLQQDEPTMDDGSAWGPSGDGYEQYYLMNPVMATAYHAALAALVGRPMEGAPIDVPMAAMPFPAMPQMAPFFGAMAPQQQYHAGAQQQQHGMFPYGYGYPPQPYAPYGPYPPTQAPQQQQGGGGGDAFQGGGYFGRGFFNPAPGGVAAAQGRAAAGMAPAPQQQHGGAAGAQGAAADAGVGDAQGGNNGRQIRVRLIRLDIKMLLQLGVFALILYQHCSPQRFFMLLFGGLTLYLTALVPMRRALQNLVGNAARGGAAGAGGRVGGGFFREIQMVFVGFIASLLPGWNFNADDAAAFQAAQEMVAADGAAQNNNGRDHQD